MRGRFSGVALTLMILAQGFAFAETIPEAAFRNDKAAVTGLLQSGNDPNQAFTGATGLHIAAEWGYFDVAELLLNNGANASAVDSYQRTALIWAILNDHVELAELLISHGCDPNWHDDSGNSALSAAAKNKNVLLVRKLLENNATIANDDALPLRHAVDSGSSEIVHLLIEAGANPCIKPENDIGPFTVAGDRESLEVIKHLAESVDRCPDRKTLLNDALTEAASKGRFQIVEYLFPLVVSARDQRSPEEYYASRPDGWRALMEAVKKNRLQIVSFLLEKTPDLSTDQLGELLVEALEIEKRPIFHVLMNNGASPEGRERALSSGMVMNSSPLTLACHRGDFEAAKLLIEHGASVKRADDFRLTPLLEAARSGNVPIIELLFKHGSKCNEADQDKRGPLLNAAILGNSNACLALIKQGCDPNAKDEKTGFTALHFAAYRGDIKLARLLLSNHANARMKDTRGRNASDIAEERGASDIVQLLVTSPFHNRKQDSHR